MITYIKIKAYIGLSGMSHCSVFQPEIEAQLRLEPLQKGK